MKRNILSAAIAGLAGGLVFGTMMQMMTAPAPDGGKMPMMQMVASLAGSDQVAMGWIYHLFNSAVIGALFGGILGSRVSGLCSGLAWGSVYGAAWWVLGALVLMPLILGMPAFAPLVMAPMRPVAMGSLIGHLVYGLVTGAVFARLRQKAAYPMRTAA